MAEIEVERAAVDAAVNQDAYAFGGRRFRRRRDVSWGAIIAGVLIALASMLVMSLIGLAFGLGVLTPDLQGSTYAAFGTGAGIWYVISKLVSLFIGGFAAARLSANLDPGRALLHGAAVWALAALGSLWLAASTVGYIASGAAGALGGTAGAVGNLVQAVVPDDLDLPGFSSTDLTLSSLPPRLQNAIREQGLTADQMRAELRGIARDVISREEQRRARNIATDTAVSLIRSPGDADADFRAAIDRLVGEGGVISDEDRREFRTALRTRLGLTAREADQLAARFEQRARNAAAEVRQTAAEVRRDALAAADQASDTLALIALWTAIALLLGLGAAVAGAATGRNAPTTRTVTGAVIAD